MTVSERAVVTRTATGMELRAVIETAIVIGTATEIVIAHVLTNLSLEQGSLGLCLQSSPDNYRQFAYAYGGL